MLLKSLGVAGLVAIAALALAVAPAKAERDYGSYSSVKTNFIVN